MSHKLKEKKYQLRGKKKGRIIFLAKSKILNIRIFFIQLEKVVNFVKVKLYYIISLIQYNIFELYNII